MTQLQIGTSDPNDVTSLQQFLQQHGTYTGPIDGKFGPLTQGAVKAFQGQNGLSMDGIVGPLTWNAIDNYGKTTTSPSTAAAAAPTGTAADQSEFNTLTDSNYNTPVTSTSFNETQANDTYDAEQKLAKDQADYNDYLSTSAQNFKDAKNTADENSAKNGVLFSTGRVQDQNNLQNAYAADQASKLADYSSDIDTTANDYQYKYGNSAANSLSSYYGLGGNTYGATGTTPVVGTKSTTQVYNPSSQNYTGTQNDLRKYYAELMASGQLGSINNKALLYGNTNQL